MIQNPVATAARLRYNIRLVNCAVAYLNNAMHTKLDLRVLFNVELAWLGGRDA